MTKKILSPSIIKAVLLLLLSSMVLSACGASRGGRTYSDGEVRTVQRVYYGTVTSVEHVRVEDDPSGLGAVIGGVAGGVLGSMIGKGRGRTLGILGGAAGGAALGHMAESGVRDYNALQLTVQLDDGSTVVIVQGEDEYFSAGDKVRIITTGQDSARVQHI